MFTAIDTTTNETKAIDIATMYTDGDYSAFVLFDRTTRKPINWDHNAGWELDTDEVAKPEDGERFTEIFGETEEAWENAANAKLADYGLRLGEYDAVAESYRVRNSVA